MPGGCCFRFVRQSQKFSPNLKSFRRPFSKGRNGSTASRFCFCSTALGGNDCLGCLADKTPHASGAKPLVALRRARNSYASRAPQGVNCKNCPVDSFCKRGRPVREGVPFLRHGGLPDASPPGKGRGKNPVIETTFSLAEPYGLGSSCA